MTKDMTSGNPLKLILLFSIPLLIGNVFQQFYSMVDTIIVGQFLGVQALAAVGSTGSIVFLIFGLTLGFTSGVSVLISQKFGANDEEGVRKAVASSITLSLILIVFMTTFSLLLIDPLLSMMNTPSDIYNDAKSYITVSFAGIFALIFYNLMASILRSVGDSKTPLYFLIMACIINIVLDLIFIINFNMGVAGASLATVIAQAISGFLCLIYAYKKLPLLKLKKEDFKCEKEYYTKHLKVAIPMSLQFSIIALGTMIMQGAVNSFGSDVVGAFTAANKVEQFTMQPSISFGVTMATFCAQNLGAKNFDNIREGVRKCILINIILGISAAFILVNFGEVFVKMFVSNPSDVVVNHATEYLNTVAYFFIPLSLIFVFRNALQGMGYGFMPMMVGVFELVGRAVGTYALVPILGYSGLCLASPIAWIFACIPLMLDYNKRIKKLTSAEFELSI
ncbi:MAG: MATE family efflux transporter [Peptostreptococcaceae bacterium]